MSTNYQESDHKIIDYELFPLPGLHRLLRGPPPRSLQPGEYFASVGAAQTFGRYCSKPFPALLSERLDLPALNLGIAGAGPAFFNRRRPLLGYVNKARFAIVQIMSGRSESNSRFESDGSEMLQRHSDGTRIAAFNAYQELLRTASEADIADTVAETRVNWVSNMQRLLTSIQVPKVLLWFSTRRPEYTIGYKTVEQLFGEFPQLVDRDMVDALRPFADDHVEVVTNRGFPQPLYNRFTGKRAIVYARPDLGGGTRTQNDYYPSPEMHEDAADALEPSCRRLRETTASPSLTR